MAQAHTPGPWSVDLDYVSRDGRASINSEGWIALARVVVRMEGDETTCEDGIANARLIAAAPDLLEALEAAIAMLDALKAESGRDIEWGEEDPFRMGEWFESQELTAMENMRAAIAKAKGGAE